MVQMATPWKHPRSGIFYVYRQIPERLRPEMGGKQFYKVSLGTREPAEAARLFVLANAVCQRLMDEAAERVTAQAVADEISPERASAIVTRFLATTRPENLFYPHTSLELTWWIEENCVRLHGFEAERYVPRPRSDLSQEPHRGQGKLLAGDQWLDFIREKPRSVWIKVCDEVLIPLFGAADPPIKRIPANENALMDAWNARVRDDNARFRAEVEGPIRHASHSRLRPDLRFEELVARWAAKRSPRPQSVHEVRKSVQDLIAFLGDIPVSQFTKDMLLDYRDAGADLPLGMPRADQAMPFPERVAKYRDIVGRKVSPTTVKKRIGAIQTLLSFAERERWIDGNVGARVTVDGAGKAKTSRRTFRQDELQALFASDLFLHPENLVSRRTAISDLTLFWLFLLGLTSGARIEEIGQAHLSDVRTEAGIHYIDITDYVDEGDLEKERSEKSVKTDGSRRIIPLHDRLLEAGFLRYVETLRNCGQHRLFPDLKANSFDKVTKEASRRANRHIDKVLSTDKRIVFHSFRHTFKDQGREAEIQERILDQLCGHSPTSVGGNYGQGVGIASLKRNLDRMTFEAVAWQPIIEAAGRIDWVELMKKRAT
ncbi:site-specific integrase [Sphingobium sp. CFD-2]|uniref:site-specific integrase n=1 Tax=Sphingobium sp. CFD-2 TaxID=2878542 RepID=UPI00214BD088|nr:site-specific integrase [Sphingobium sp. CFD-2]